VTAIFLCGRYQGFCGERMKLTSPVFDDKERIPERHGFQNENVSPPLRFHDVPGDAVSLALVMDDPDALKPAGKVWDHWVVWNIPPAVSELDEGFVPEAAVQGMTDYGERGYGGPNPPDGEHTYRFRLYALDTEIDRDGSTGKKELEKAMQGHVIEQASLRGTYTPD